MKYAARVRPMARRDNLHAARNDGQTASATGDADATDCRLFVNRAQELGFTLDEAEQLLRLRRVNTGRWRRRSSPTSSRRCSNWSRCAERCGTCALGLLRRRRARVPDSGGPGAGPRCLTSRVLRCSARGQPSSPLWPPASVFSRGRAASAGAVGVRRHGVGGPGPDHRPTSSRVPRRRCRTARRFAVDQPASADPSGEQVDRRCRGGRFVRPGRWPELVLAQLVRRFYGVSTG